jgi:hypothetical protein
VKIRWTEDSIRFRITPAEMARLERGEAVDVVLSLPGGGGWRAAIESGPATMLRAAGADVGLVLSPSDLARLTAPDAEGVYFTTDGDKPLRYFVEKDFPCVHPGAKEAKEPLTETFAPPRGFKERHAAR